MKLYYYRLSKQLKYPRDNGTTHGFGKVRKTYAPNKEVAMLNIREKHKQYGYALTNKRGAIVSNLGG